MMFTILINIHFFFSISFSVLISCHPYSLSSCFLVIDHVDDIIASFFQYVKMLREIGPKDWIFKEVQVC